METITTTNLRTQSKELVNTLKKGGTVSLIHHSQIVGVIKPAATEKKRFNPKEFEEFIKRLDLSPTTYEERERIYRKHLEEKCGKNLS